MQITTQFWTNNKQWLIWGILAMALLLRIYLAATTVYVWDEDRDWIVIAERISFDPESPYLPLRDGQHAAMSAYFIKLGSLLLGKNPVGFRAANLVAGMLMLVLVYVLVKKWKGEHAAWWAAGLLAFNEYHAGISILAMEKSFYLLFTLLAVYAIYQFMQHERPRYLYLASVAAGIGFLCKELTFLIIPVFFLFMLLSRHRIWLRRKETYFALLFFLLVISPDLVWNITNPATTAETANYLDHLSRIGGIGFSRQPFLFYGRDAAAAVYSLLGRTITDRAPEYPAMNVLFGAILLGTVTWMTIRVRKEDEFTRFLLLFFWAVFTFFVLIRPGTGTKSTLDAAVWFWVDMTLLPAAILAGVFVARLSGSRRFAAFSLVGLATAYAIVGVFFWRLDLPTRAIVFSPEFLWPADNELVETRANFQFCFVCDQDPDVELVEIMRVNSRTGAALELSPAQVSGADVGTDDRQFLLRAVPEPADTRYIISYRVTDSSENSYVMRESVRIEPGDWVPPFWSNQPEDVGVAPVTP